MDKKIAYDRDKISKLSKGFKNKNKYVKDEFSFPETNINPLQKNDLDYILMWVEKIYSLFVKKRTWMRDDYGDIPTMRSYVDGEQSVDQYRDFLYGATEKNIEKPIDSDGYDQRNDIGGDTFKRMAWVSIDEKPLSIFPKIMTKILEQSRAVYYEMGVNAIDSMSASLEETAAAKLMFEKENKEWLNGQRAMLGIQTEEPDFEPINVNELMLYKNSGGFKVPYASVLELLLQHSFDISYWDKDVRENVLKDLVAFGYSMVRDYFDEEDLRMKVKWVDPEVGGLQYSRTFSYKDSEYGFELEYWSISKVRKKFNLSFEQAASLAFSYSGQYGNPGIGSWEKYGYSLEDGVCGFDFYQIPVFRCEWIDIDNEKYYKHTTVNGKIYIKPLKNKNEEGLDVYDRPIRYVREATWVPGTKYLTDFGKVKYMSRPNPKKPRISYRGIKLGVPSLCKQIRPLLNGLTQAWWKTQEAIAIAISNGISVDVGALKEVSIGKNKSWDVLQLLKYYRQQAILLHKGKNALFGSGNGVSPVAPLITRMEENIKAQFEMMSNFMGLIESISGINLVSTGDTPEPRLGKYNMQIALEGTNQIVGSIIRASTELQEDVGINLMYRIRGLCKGDNNVKKSYSDVVGEHDMKILMLAEKDNVQYGLRVEARDISQMKTFIEEILVSSIKAVSGGQSGLLDPSEVMLIRDMMDQRQNMRLISLTLGYILRKKSKEKELSDLKKIELQGDQLLKVEKEKEKNNKNVRIFELVKLQKEFENEFMIKFGYTPNQAMKNVAGDIPPVAINGNEGQPEVPAQVAPAQPVTPGT